jgi:hypothetical protein
VIDFTKIMVFEKKILTIGTENGHGDIPIYGQLGALNFA